MKIQFGFNDLQYGARYSLASPIPASIIKRVAKHQSLQQKAYGAGKTTGDVAKEIERRYGLVEVFYGLEEDSLIVPLLEEDYSDALEAEMSGFQTVAVLTTRTENKIINKFRRNLTGRRYDGLIRGVPTRAATGGVSHLSRNPYASRSSRPSFVNTGLYMRSFTVWEE